MLRGSLSGIYKQFLFQITYLYLVKTGKMGRVMKSHINFSIGCSLLKALKEKKKKKKRHRCQVILKVSIAGPLTSKKKSFFGVCEISQWKMIQESSIFWLHRVKLLFSHSTKFSINSAKIFIYSWSIYLQTHNPIVVEIKSKSLGSIGRDFVD